MRNADRRHRRLLACFLGVLGGTVWAAAQAPEAGAAIILPNVTYDEYNPANNGNCSLREAVESVNIGSDYGGCSCCSIGPYGGDIIALRATAPYMLSLAGPSEDNNATGDLDILVSVIIRSLGGTATIRGDPDGFDDRILHFHNISPAILTADVSHISVEGGNLNGSDGCGGGILVEGDTFTTVTLDNSFVRYNTVHDGTTADGGGVCNDAMLFVLETSISSNVAKDGTTASRGGGLYNEGIVDASIAKFNKNEVSGSPLNAGGGIANYGSATVTLDSSWVTNNLVTTSDDINCGGGIYQDAPPFVGVVLSVVLSTIEENTVTKAGTFGRGGGLCVNAGDLTIDRSTIRNNTVKNAGGTAATLEGGGLWLFGGENFILYTTFSDNWLSGNGQPAKGGGIYATAMATAPATKMWNSTLSGNGAKGGTMGRGGAVYIDGTAELDLSFVTLAENWASNVADGIYVNLGTSIARLKATILDNTAPGENCGGSGSIISFDFNIETGVSCGLGLPDDLSSTDPLLYPLGAYGGPTLTHAIDALSPAWQWVAFGSCTRIDTTPLTDDQRLFPRPSQVLCDTGSFEFWP